MTAVFYDAPHKAPPRPVYKDADGNRVPSVTTIISATQGKEGLAGWANRLGFMQRHHDVEVSVLAGVGSLVHECISESLGGDEAQIDNYSLEQRIAASVAYKHWEEWTLAHRLSLPPHLLEKPLVHPLQPFGGTIDAILWVDGAVTLIDWKTSNGIWPEHVIQLAAYWLLAEAHGIKVEQARVVQLSREKGEGWHQVKYTRAELVPAMEAFGHALRLYQTMHKVRALVPDSRAAPVLTPVSPPVEVNRGKWRPGEALYGPFPADDVSQKGA